MTTLLDRASSFIETIVIDKFYELEGQTISGLTPGLNVFFGPNEAGKTTVLEFIRSIFFGFSQKVPREWGGRIYFWDNSLGQTLTIERLGGSKKGRLIIRAEDGKEIPQTHLANIIKGANEKIFKNCFAFGLQELQDVATLEEKGVKDAIFAATSGISPKLLSSIRNFLDEQETALFRPRGQRPRLNMLIKELKKLDAEINELKKEIKETTMEENEILSLKKHLPRLENELKEMERKISHLGLMEQLYDKWLKFRQLKERLKTYGPTCEVAHIEDGLGQRLTSKLDQISRLKKELQGALDEISEIEDKASRIVIDHQLMEKSEEIIRVADKFTFIPELLKEMEELRSRKDILEERLNALSIELGANGGSARHAPYMECDTSLVKRKRFLKLFEDINGKGSEIKAIMSEEKGLRTTINTIEDEIIGVDTEIQALDQEKNHLESGLEDAKSLFGLFKESLAKEEGLTQEIKREESLLKRQLCFLPLGIGGLTYFLVNRYLKYNNLIILIIFSLILVTVYNLWRKKQKIRDTKKKLDRILKEKREIAQNISSLCQNRLKDHLGSEGSYDVDDFLHGGEEIFRRIIFNVSLRIEAIKGQRSHLKAVLKDKTKAKDKALASLKHLEESLKTYKEELKAREEEITSLLKAYGIDEMVDQGVFFQFLDRIERLKEVHMELDALDQRLMDIEGKLDHFLEEVMKGHLEGLLPLEAPPSASIKEIYRALQRAKDRLIENLGKRELLEELSRRRTKKEKEITQIKAELEKGEEEVDRILAMVGAKDIDEFWQLEEEIKEAKELELELQRISIELSQVGEDFEAIFTRYKRHEIRQEIQEIQGRLSRLYDERDETLKALGSYDEKIRQIQKKDRLKELRQKHQGVVSEIRQLAHRWATVRTAKLIFEEAKRSLEEENQPEVIRLGTRYFSIFTDQKYKKIHFDMEQTSVTVEDGLGRIKEVSQLSRGTKEQLLLAIRFGYMLTIGTDLPAVMDDILVNFDDERARLATRALDELAQKKQTFFFTCHSSTLETFKGTSANIVEWPPTLSFHLLDE